MLTLIRRRRINLTKLEPEFQQPCRNGGSGNCDRSADWLIWGSHSQGHRPETLFSCDHHKQVSERDMLASVKEGKSCWCGWQCAGQISDHLRAIRL